MRSPAGAVPGRSLLVWPTLLVALIALGGSLWLSLGMQLKACPLCFYQRTFVMGVVAILGIGVLAGQRHRTVLNVLALPLAVAAVAVAAFHVYLELTGKLECPAGLMGVGTAPQQSLAILTVLLLFATTGASRACRAGESGFAVAAGLILGVLLAVAAVWSAPPPQPPPQAAYAAAPDVCRPPYRAR